MKKASAKYKNMFAAATVSMILIISMLAAVYAQAAQIAIVRYAPTSGETGNSTNITLSVNIDELNPPSIYILYEDIPPEFTIVNRGGASYDTDNRRLKWYRFSMFGLPMVDENFTYKISANEAGTYNLSGYAKTTDTNPYNTTGSSSITFTATQVPLDSDGDGILDSADNCPFADNAGQENNDNDTQGDACDLDDDNDGDADTTDCAPMNNSIFHGALEICGNDIDENCDGLDLQCGVDSDGDGIEDALDNCPTINNPTQANYDGDSMGDACDADDDNDNDPDSSDCNDNNHQIYTGAAEICGNGVDEDCNGLDLVCVGPITATRTMPASANPDQEFNVSIFVDVNVTDQLSQYTLRETIPAGIVLTDLGDGQYNAQSRVLKWTVVRSSYFGIHTEDKTFRYKAKSNTSGTHTIAGTVQANSVYYGTQGNQNILITGNSQPDTDGDGIFDSQDNCPTVGNVNQNDRDGDHIGDVCDPDNDNDGDADTSDCAPYNPAIYHGAPELCNNQIDENCNGQVDENCQTCTDADQDGYGSPASGICAHPQLDCNDASNTVYPGAAEICDDGIDQDCNGADLTCAITYPIEVQGVHILNNDGNAITQVTPGMQFHINVTNKNVGEDPLIPMQIIQITHNDVPIGMISLTNTINSGATSIFSGMFTLPETSTAGIYTIKVFSWNDWASKAGWKSYSEIQTATFNVV